VFSLVLDAAKTAMVIVGAGREGRAGGLFLFCHFG